MARPPKTWPLEDHTSFDGTLTYNTFRAAEIAYWITAPTEEKWLWPGRIPYAGLTLVVGEPACGKSTFVLDLAARISKGELGTGGSGLGTGDEGGPRSKETQPESLSAFEGKAEKSAETPEGAQTNSNLESGTRGPEPDAPNPQPDPRDDEVLLWNSKDSPGRFVLPMLLAAGAELNRIRAVAMSRGDRGRKRVQGSGFRIGRAGERLCGKRGKRRSRFGRRGSRERLRRKHGKNC